MKFLESNEPGFERVLLNQASASTGVQVGERPLYVHARSACEDDPACVIHKPSDHHMKDWPLNWRGDTGVMERICSHGCGHPDPDAMAFETSGKRVEQYAHFLQRMGPDEYPVGYFVEEARSIAAAKGVHGCCGCCRPPAPEAVAAAHVQRAFNR